jgi:hypothetical protein
MGAYGTAGELVSAVKQAKALGFRRIDTATPCPVAELHEILEFKPSPVRWWMLGGGIAGAVGGFVLQVTTVVLDYPFRVGGRPLASWPLFVPVAFELAILCAALAGFFCLLRTLRLPRFNHPVFEHPQFHRATTDRFFLILLPDSHGLSVARAVEFLERTNARDIAEVAG